MPIFSSSFAFDKLLVSKERRKVKTNKDKKNTEYLLRRFNSLNISPQTAIITGSGIKLFRDKAPIFEVSYSELTKQRIKGHEEILKVYRVRNESVLVFSGRKHLYEGLSFSDVTANVRLCYKLGIKKLIITNAAGGISKNLKAGDLMLITGFIDLMQATERGILNGITQPPFKIKTRLTVFLKRKLKSGIYAGMQGPSYETYSEIKLLQSLGASAVGMSTVPEIICAKSLGMNYAAVSVISNVWNKNHKPSHKEVLEQVKRVNKKLNDLISRLI